MLAELERDRGADHRVLPVHRGRETAHPAAPILARRFFHPAHRFADIAGKGLVGTEEEMEVRFDAESELLHRSEEHTSELQSLMRISYAVFCLKKKNTSTKSKQKHHK